MQWKTLFLNVTQAVLSFRLDMPVHTRVRNMDKVILKLFAVKIFARIITKGNTFRVTKHSRRYSSHPSKSGAPLMPSGTDWSDHL